MGLEARSSAPSYPGTKDLLLITHLLSRAMIFTSEVLGQFFYSFVASHSKLLLCCFLLGLCHDGMKTIVPTNMDFEPHSD
jgi:hypothetical protein